MKNLTILFVLIASSNIAHSEVRLSGEAEVGLIKSITPTSSTSGIGWELIHDLDITFVLFGTTDNGILFGSSFDASEIDDKGAFDPTSGEAKAVFVSGSFGTITLGDVDGAFGRSVSEYGTGTSIDETTELSFMDVGDNAGLDGLFGSAIVRYEYTVSGFTFSTSIEMDPTGVNDSVYGLGASWVGSIDEIRVNAGIGYQITELGATELSVQGASFGLGYGYWDLSLLYTDQNNPFGMLGPGPKQFIDATYYGASLEFSKGALSVGANYAVQNGDPTRGFEGKGYGLWGNLDLGGGLVATIGYGRAEFPGLPGRKYYEKTSAGFSMAF